MVVGVVGFMCDDGGVVRTGVAWRRGPGSDACSVVWNDPDAAASSVAGRANGT